MAQFNINEAVFYLRMRLLRLHEMNRVVYPQKTWTKIERCLKKKTMPEEVEKKLLALMPETTTSEFARDLEFALVEAHGEGRYAEPERLVMDIEAAAIKYRIAVMMDSIYKECGHEFVRSRQERLEDAAWWSVPEAERGMN